MKPSLNTGCRAALSPEDEAEIRQVILQVFH